MRAVYKRINAQNQTGPNSQRRTTAPMYIEICRKTVKLPKTR